MRSFSDSSEDRMNIHKNARLTPHGRERIVRQVRRAGRRRRPPHEPQASARERCANGWRASRPKASTACRIAPRGRIACAGRRPRPIVEQIEALRRQRWTGKQIAAEVGVSPATVSRILKRLGLNRIQALEPAEPVRRYEREHPGELIHIDIKKLGRFERVGHRITGDRSRQSKVPRRRLGVRPCLHRRRLAPRLLADPARREEGERRRLPQGRRRLLRQPRRHASRG